MSEEADVRIRRRLNCPDCGSRFQAIQYRGLTKLVSTMGGSKHWGEANLAVKLCPTCDLSPCPRTLPEVSND